MPYPFPQGDNNKNIFQVSDVAHGSLVKNFGKQSGKSVKLPWITCTFTLVHYLHVVHVTVLIVVNDRTCCIKNKAKITGNKQYIGSLEFFR